MRAMVIFNQSRTLSAADGQLVELAGHRVFLQPGTDGYQECVAHVVHRPVHLDSGVDIDEIAFVIVDGSEPMARLCATARDLAGSVAAHLPPA
jgi:hypothetical protein